MKSLIVAILIFSSFVLSAQNSQTERIIEVRGSAEMEIQPDEIKYIITIEEYWKEEFEKRKEFKDYKTKVPLAEIEDGLIKNLRKVGIPKEDITVQNMGNYYRYRGKEFLYSKQLILRITDFSKINKLTEIANAKGIKQMRIGELNHTKIDDFKKQIKINALKDAKEKAEYLVESINEELGEVVSITEISDGFLRPFQNEVMPMRAIDTQRESIDNVENIKISYQVRARFRIK